VVRACQVRWLHVVVLPLFGSLGAGVMSAAGPVQPEPVNPAITRQKIEADWLHQDAVRAATGLPQEGEDVAPEEDALGGCDGVKNGTWGFHTEKEDNPWWQVDLGQSTRLNEIRVYNRCDQTAKRNSRLIVLVSDDARSWRQVYQHDGTTFLGQPDRKPLVVGLNAEKARYVRLQLPGNSYFHLDEVEVYAAGDTRNVALGRPATQSSTSRWSTRHAPVAAPAKTYATSRVIERGLLLAESLRRLGAAVEQEAGTLRRVAEQLGRLPEDASEATRRGLYLEARWAVRKMALSNPLLDFDTILFVKRAPGMFPHMSDQYYGWWSRGGGGIYLLKGFKGDEPRVECLTDDWPVGNFLRPDLSYDGKRVLFAYCKHYPDLARVQNKVDKEALPEDSFYSIFEMNIDGSGIRQLTRGRYDDFDARYLPDGRIVFLSTRKGIALQAGRVSAAATCERTCADSYVRCGGGNSRPVAIFTLHRMDGDGGNLCAISAFESFEWTPSVAHDGRILYARWDYIDRFNGPFMSLWSTNPDGTNGQLVYGNYTKRPQCVFEARAIPNSRKLVFTASAHHSITGGSLCLLDRTRGTEYDRPITRLTPEVPFPETERNVDMYYAGPFPLSEEYFLVGWSDRRLPSHKLMWEDDPKNPKNAMGLYLVDAFGNLEPLYRDPEISSMYPIPLRRRAKPAVRASVVDWGDPEEGRFLLQDVYEGLDGIERGTVKRLRVVGVPPKTQPQMNSPVLGVSREDPGKFVLGTVPVEEDGSASFRVPSGLPVFFQALDGDGLAVQTMRSLTYVQPGQTLSCIGCHESRDTAPAVTAVPLAALREPSKLAPGPEGSWPLRFDRLVQPVLDRHCVGCHSPQSDDRQAARLDLTAANSYQTLISFGEEDLKQLAFEKDASVVGDGVARNSKLLASLTEDGGHEGVELDGDSLRRLVTWMDLYSHKQGFFSEGQERQLHEVRKKWADMIASDDSGGS